MVENDQIITELSYQSKQVEEILHENVKLKEENKSLRRKLSVLTQLEDELTKKNQNNQQIILTWVVKKDELDKKVVEDLELMHQQNREAGVQQDQIQTQLAEAKIVSCLEC
jgi:regulator of replication initiation timing